MAVRTTRVDDISPDVEATQTILFSIGGEGYSIDLGDQNADKLRKALAPYVKVATSVPLRELVKLAANGGTGEVDPQLIRSWAQAKGLDVADKGRVSESIVAQWRAAGSPQSW